MVGGCEYLLQLQILGLCIGEWNVAHNTVDLRGIQGEWMGVRGSLHRLWEVYIFKVLVMGQDQEGNTDEAGLLEWMGVAEG